MAASSNPSSSHHEGSVNGNGAAGNGIPVPENSAVDRTKAALRHNPGLCLEWTADEQSLLEELLTKYSSDTNMVQYAKIAMQLQDKTVRDVALRCRWMAKKENSKRRKEDHNSSRRNKDKKEKVTDSLPKLSHVTTRAPNSQTALPMDNDDGISYKAIGGAAGQLLEQNAHALEQISANFSALKIHENINIFCQARNTILAIMNDLNDMPELMKQMPPLPVKLNEELATSVLPWSALHKNS